MPLHNWMDLRISVEKLCKLQRLKSVSLYLERDKKILEKFYLGSCILAQSVRFFAGTEGSNSGELKAGKKRWIFLTKKQDFWQKAEKLEKMRKNDSFRVKKFIGF